MHSPFYTILLVSSDNSEKLYQPANWPRQKFSWKRLPLITAVRLFEPISICKANNQGLEIELHSPFCAVVL